MKKYYYSFMLILSGIVIGIGLVSCGGDDPDDTYGGGGSELTAILQDYKWMSRDYEFNDYDDWVELTEDAYVYYFISDNEGYLRHYHKWIDTSGIDDEGSNVTNIYFTYRVSGNTIRISPYYRTQTITLTYDGTYLKNGNDYYRSVSPSAGDWEQIRKLYGTTGRCSWRHDSGLKSLIIRGEGSMGDYTTSNQPWKSLPYNYVFIEEGVTSIGSHAFYNNSGLTEVYLDDAESLTSIGIEAFAKTSIEEIRIPASVVTIGEAAFGDCKRLTSVKFLTSGNSLYNSDLRGIGDMAFNGCNLKTLSIPFGVEEIGKYAFSGSFSHIELGPRVSIIGVYAFSTSSTSGWIDVNRGNPPTANTALTPYDNKWTLNVPVGCKSAYQRTSPWKNFKTIKEDSSLEKGDDYVDDPDEDPDDDSDDAYSGETFSVTANGVTFKMIGVSGGTFQMGSTDSEADDDEKPVHRVTLSDFSIGQTEVTQELWEAVMGYRPTPGGSQWTSKYGLGDDYPAYYISWNDCQEFIEKLNMLTGRTFRMPTEAEWEYAARGGNSSRGYKYSGSNTIGDVAWYYDNSGGTTHKVATKQPNELGIYDMSGNVWEWCSDWYNKNYYSNSPSTNPTGPSSGSNRVHRGGSRYHNAGHCRGANRGHYTPASTYDYLGLRLAL